MTSTPLPAARPSVFTTQGPGSVRRNAWRVGGRRRRRRSARSARRPRRGLLHEGLRPFEPGPVGAGAEHETAIGAQPVGQAVHERLPRARSRTGRRRSPRAASSVTVMQPSPPCGRSRRRASASGVPRGHHDVGGAGQGRGPGRARGRPTRRHRPSWSHPSDRTDDHGDAHAANRTNCSRPGPTPTSLIGHPDLLAPGTRRSACRRRQVGRARSRPTGRCATRAAPRRPASPGAAPTGGRGGSRSACPSAS